MKVFRKIDTNLIEDQNTVSIGIDTLKFFSKWIGFDGGKKEMMKRIASDKKAQAKVKKVLKTEDIREVQPYTIGRLIWFKDQIDWLEEHNIEYKFNVVVGVGVVTFVVKFAKPQDAVHYKLIFKE